MSYELRTYTSTPGNMDGMLARFRTHTVGLFAEHGIESIGYWIDAENPDVLIYVVRHHGDPAGNWAAFQADERWIAAKAKSVENGELVASIDSTYLTPTDFSPLG